MDGNSLNPQKELAEFLKSQFPQVFADGKIDGDKLKKALGEELDTNNERYGLTWAGKNECFRHIQETTTATLKIPDLKSQNSENIFIEGDNLEVLKVLQKNYYGKIKMIYIDPPYNTGNDSFIYPDKFKEEKEDYEQRAGIKDAEGLLTKDGFWRKNSKDSGYFHSNWLSMMYPRLFLAKNLLKENGLIFVSIDDNEIHNLRMIMNEIFGEHNFIEQIIWKNKYGAGAKTKGFISIHEYILCYSKQPIDNLDSPLGESEIKKHNKKDSKFPIRGGYRTQPLETKSLGDRANLIYPIMYQGEEIWPDKQWVWSKERMEQAIKNDEVEIIKYKGKWSVRSKQYLKDENGVMRRGKPLSIFNGPYTQEATMDMRALFKEDVFPFSKPKDLLKQILSYRIDNKDDKDELVLDFFAGSCPLAQAVMELNAEDRSKKKFICVQLAEPCEEESEAYKAGFKTIAEIGKERIRRAAKKIKEEAKGKLNFDDGKLDLGFKVFRLEQSNFKQWRENIKEPGEFKKNLLEMVDNVAKGAKPEDMLFEIILKNSRFDLNVKIEKKNFDAIDYYNLADGIEIICLADKITKKLVEKIIQLKPEKFTCLDVAFKDNDQLKTNTALQMEAEKIEFKVI
ncbi:MAG: site-specific DNA-methyltransferase [Planctomycetes bacterium]|nr:site-specific DNA-methyltransferase [Planctomycetota bacterium]MBU1518977.1 site-specific DNA-methyltransferase [Planctomycetota bacterium]MBU2457476.1 site-specific DNA-methyltransferase [Planctomycetota bacterium]MBU2596253.1 site-specific DNA-methyltransferase [Planctomycetota bacterium]